jgi:predicted CXXCH cytochrome family protein
MTKVYLKYFSLSFVFIILGAVGLFGQETTAQLSELGNDHCYNCHKEMEVLPDDFHGADIHMQPGLSCAGCHGGDPTQADPDAAMDPTKGFVGVPSRQQIPQFCGKCHSSIDFMRTYRPRMETDQVQQYFTSVHGKRLKKGDNKVAECASCHSAHNILPAEDTRSSVYPTKVPYTCNRCHGDADYMKEYGIPTDQFDKYVNSVHGKMLLEKNDISAPTCNDCHGNHGATPPGVKSISHVCGNCHVNNMDYFTSSPMAKVFQEMDFHACEQCHGDHGVQPTNDNMVGVGDSSVCINCHSEGDKGYVAAQEIHGYLRTLAGKYDHAQNLLHEVQKKGMEDVDILFTLQQANQDLIHTRTIVHTFQPAKVHEKAEQGIEKTGKAINMAQGELKEYVTRTRGFGVATIFITVLVIALFFKIREMERRKKSG